MRGGCKQHRLSILAGLSVQGSIIDPDCDLQKGLLQTAANRLQTNHPHGLDQGTKIFVTDTQ